MLQAHLIETIYDYQVVANLNMLAYFLFGLLAGMYYLDALEHPRGPKPPGRGGK